MCAKEALLTSEDLQALQGSFLNCVASLLLGCSLRPKADLYGRQVSIFFMHFGLERDTPRMQLQKQIQSMLT